MKKRGWIVLFLAFPLWMQGQSAREEIGKNPALAAGKYYAYQAPEEKLTPAPAGYDVNENFMLNPKSCVVVGYELDESSGVLVCRS